MQSYKIRNIEKKDFEQIREMDGMLWLSVQWNSTFHTEDGFVAVKEDDTVLGIATLSYDGTWYYLEENRDDIPLYRMQIELRTRPGIESEEEIKTSLTDALKNRLQEFKKKYPEKRLCIRCWCESEETGEQQFWLQQGFGAVSVIWILKYDLNKEIPKYIIPDNIQIGPHEFEGEQTKAYFKANALGYDNVQDAEGELFFRLGDEKTICFTAKDGDKVVASTTVWNIGGGRSATENVFTIPEYRRKNIGRATLAYALEQLKERGDTVATLTCVGDNLSALSMYLGMGYEVMGHLIEMHYEL